VLLIYTTAQRKDHAAIRLPVNSKQNPPGQLIQSRLRVQADRQTHNTENRNLIHFCGCEIPRICEISQRYTSRGIVFRGETSGGLTF
jgi:hypothetical protein